MSNNIKRNKVVEQVPHKPVQFELFSPFAKLPNADGIINIHARMGLPPYHDMLHIHCTRRPHLGGAGAVEVGKTK